MWEVQKITHILTIEFVRCLTGSTDVQVLSLIQVQNVVIPKECTDTKPIKLAMNFVF